MKKIINTQLPYNCSTSELTEDQRLQGDWKNLGFIKAIADDLESKIQEGEYLTRETFLKIQPHKIITVLVQNAYDAIQKANRFSTPVITVDIEIDENNFMLYVTDNGIGFNANDHYDGCIPFGGHGSGLAEVKDLVKSVNGKLTTNDNTIGATVSIEIPIKS